MTIPIAVAKKWRKWFVGWKDKEATCQQPKKQILAVHFYGFYRHFYELEFGKTFV